MPKTPNLDLNIGAESTETVLDYRTKLNGNNDGTIIPFSDIQKIDTWAGTVNGLLDGVETLLAAI